MEMAICAGGQLRERERVHVPHVRRFSFHFGFVHASLYCVCSNFFVLVAVVVFVVERFDFIECMALKMNFANEWKFDLITKFQIGPNS